MQNRWLCCKFIRSDRSQTLEATSTIWGGTVGAASLMSNGTVGAVPRTSIRTVGAVYTMNAGMVRAVTSTSAGLVWAVSAYCGAIKWQFLEGQLGWLDCQEGTNGRQDNNVLGWRAGVGMMSWIQDLEVDGLESICKHGQDWIKERDVCGEAWGKCWRILEKSIKDQFMAGDDFKDQQEPNMIRFVGIMIDKNGTGALLLHWSESSLTCSANIIGYSTCNLDDRVTLVVIMALEERQEGEVQHHLQEEFHRSTGKAGQADEVGAPISQTNHVLWCETSCR